ncbi:MAG: hypothetical protein K5931_02230 [Lachnospiraceae bacterium]|nr:hypothetical protein [Lachnospiraceae bacterium]
MPHIGVRLSKKDTILAGLISQTKDVSLSEYISFMLEYYLDTGKYLNIGSIKEVPVTTGNCGIYLSNTIRDKMDIFCETNGIKISALIKMIIKNSVTVSDMPILRDIEDIQDEILSYKRRAWEQIPKQDIGSRIQDVEESGLSNKNEAPKKEPKKEAKKKVEESEEDKIFAGMFSGINDIADW